MSAYERYSDEEWERVTALKRGRTWPEVAAEVNRSVESLQVRASKVKKGILKGANHTSELANERVVKMLRKGMHVDDIASVLGVMRPAITLRLRKMGISESDVRVAQRKAREQRIVATKLKIQRGVL